MEAVLETVVRCTEIDVNGHVNNARYVEYLEWGREAWYEAHGSSSAGIARLSRRDAFGSSKAICRSSSCRSVPANAGSSVSSSYSVAPSEYRSVRWSTTIRLASACSGDM
jgi:hypothetical protein